MKPSKHLKPYNLYEVLGIEDFSGPSEIKRGYRLTALKYHPDRSPPGRDAHRKFLLCNDAYRFLRNEENRNEYDRLLKQSRTTLSGKEQDRSPGSRSKTVRKKNARPEPGMDPPTRFYTESRKTSRRSGEPGRIYSQQNMGAGKFESFVQRCREDFREFLQTIPRIQKRRY